MKKYPKITITQEMIDQARKLKDEVKVNRTIASKIDTLTGILGEFVFAQYLFGDWKKNYVGKNKGDVDFDGIEIKTSAYPFRDTLNLLVREDYAIKRKPSFYVQIIIDIPSRNTNDIIAGTQAIITGWTTHHEVSKAPKRDFGSKFNTSGGYKCYYISIRNLQPMASFKENYEIITPPISKITIEGLWNKYNIELKLNKDVNILVGDNGSGKTTIIELIHASIFKTEEREKYQFKKIKLDFGEKTFISKFIEKPDKLILDGLKKSFTDIENSNYFEVDNANQKIKNIYTIQHNFNIIRSMKLENILKIEKFSNYEFDFTLEKKLKDSIIKLKEYLTELTNKKDKIITETKNKIVLLVNGKMESDTFFDIYKEKQKQEDEKIKKLYHLFNILIKKINMFFGGEALDNYNSTNFTKKTIEKQSDNSILFIKENGTAIIPQKLSSGEKQLLILLINILLQKKESRILLLDEPEISLHLTWQIELINAIREINPNCQLIVATHSPGIFSKYYMENLIEVQFTERKKILFSYRFLKNSFKQK